MLSLSLRTRLRAGLIHLAASAVVATLAAALVFMSWYPSPLAHAQGVSHVLLILIGVDVAIGPLITAIVFDRRKKSLKFDLAVVVVLQLAALLYGLHSIYLGRPALIVFNVDRFDAVTAAEMDPAGLRLAREQGKPGLPWMQPRIVAALLPEDGKARTDILMSAAVGGPDIPQLAQYHVAYEQAAEQVRSRMRPLDEIRLTNDLADPEWSELLRSLPFPEAELAYLPLKARAHDGVVVVRRSTAEVVRILPLQPRWNTR